MNISFPQIQEKVYDEQLEIYGHDADCDVTQDELTKMKYLEACVKEALRLYPSVPIIGKHGDKMKRRKEGGVCVSN